MIDLVKTPMKKHKWLKDTCVHCRVKRKSKFNKDLGYPQYTYYHPKGGTPIRKPICYSNQLMIPQNH